MPTSIRTSTLLPCSLALHSSSHHPWLIVCPVSPRQYTNNKKNLRYPFTSALHICICMASVSGFQQEPMAMSGGAGGKNGEESRASSPAPADVRPITGAPDGEGPMDVRLCLSGQGWIGKQFGISSPVAVGVGCEAGEGNKNNTSAPTNHPLQLETSQPNVLVASYPLPFLRRLLLLSSAGWTPCHLG